MRPRGLLELVLEVADLDRSARFYREVLGLVEVERWQDPRRAIWVSIGPHAVLGLWPRQSGGPGVGIHGARGGAHVHFAIYVQPDSLPEYKSRLEDDGHQVEGPVEFWGGNMSLFVSDPDDNVLELGDWKVDWARAPVTL